MNKYKISELVSKKDYVRYGDISNTIKVSHRKDMIPYVWLQLNDDNIVKGVYCSNSMYYNRTFENVKIGDKIIIDRECND